MNCYKNGDVMRGGFRHLSDGTICVDYCEENYPLNLYLNDLILYVNKNSIKKIFINSSLSNKIDISFLEDLKSIESLQITALCNSLNPICSLRLKTLKLQVQDEIINFNNLKDSLEELEFYNLIPHHEKKLHLDISIIKCTKLKTLNVACFDSQDCEIISKINWLQCLSLVNCIDKKIELNWIYKIKGLKTLKLQKLAIKKFEFKELLNLKELIITQSDLITMDNIQNLNELEYLGIRYCPKLLDISAISKCTKSKKLQFESSKKIEDFNCLSNLINLKGLIISNCGNINSLEFINGMDNLKFLSFVDTNIENGDLTPCLRLKYVGTMDKRHYNLKSAELPHNKEFAFNRL